MRPEVLSVNISDEKGTIKTPVAEITIDQHGIIGDAHAGPWTRQVTLLAQENIQQFSAQAGRQIKYGEFAENITTKGIDLDKVSLLDRIKIGAVELEVTQIGKTCHGTNCAIFREVGKCLMPEKGIFCRVIWGGKIKPGDKIEYIPRNLRFLIITLSDRASSGEYEDLSGPKIKQIVENFFAAKRWHINIENVLLPDETRQLRDELQKAKDEAIDVIITTGGTGVGPRDFTPDVVMSLNPRIIPGIMEYIRVKCAEKNPNALLSRGIAGILEQTLIYTLPGSVKAVGEYMQEILKTMEHLILTLHGLDLHAMASMRA